MKVFNIGLIALAMVSGTAFAQEKGERIGNGGDAVHCGDKGIFMLDSIESARRGMPVTLESAEETLRSKVDVLMQRIHRKDDVLARELEKRANELMDAIETEDAKLITMTDGVLVNVADEGATHIPQGCDIMQLIIQNPQPLPGDTKYIVQKDLWSVMSLEEQAVGILHEAIYGYLLSHEKEAFRAQKEVRYSSTQVRYINGLIISGKIDQMNYKEYLAQLKLMKYPAEWWEQFGFRFDPDYMEIAPDGSLKSMSQYTRYHNVVSTQKIEPIAGIQQGLSYFSKVVLDHGQWTELYAGEQQFEEVSFDVDTLTPVIWHKFRGIFWTMGSPVFILRRELLMKNLKNLNLLCAGRVLKRTSGGYEFSQLQKPSWKLILGHPYTTNGIYYREKYTPFTVVLDHNRKIIEIKREGLEK